MKPFEEASVVKRLPLAGYGEVVLVDCKTAMCREPDSNVFLLNGKGDVVWQIEPGVRSHGAIGYSDVYLGSGGELMVYSRNGVEYVIDQSSGRILSKELIR